MTWNPLLQYDFDNHVAIDDTGNGHTGIVSIPNASCWVDNPVPGVATAIRFDNPQSQVTVPAAPTLGGWAGFRVRCVFSPTAFNRRINLVEGDLAFALFVEKDASLQGTIFDGTTWYGVTSQPNAIAPNVWYAADFEYNPATSLVLRLNDEIVDIVITHGDAVRPVGPVGIKIGYWPGGDDRYTFLGLMGPVSIDTLTPQSDLASVAGKLVCSGGTYQLKTLQEIYVNSLTVAEQTQCQQTATTLLNGINAVIAAALGTSGNQSGTIAAFSSLHDRVTQLTLADQSAGVDVFSDPKLVPLLNEGLNLVWSVSANARDTLVMQALKLAAQGSMPPERVAQLRALYPDLCLTAPSTNGFDPNGSLPIIFGPILNGLCGLCGRPSGGEGSGGSTGGYGQGAGGGSPCGCKTRPPQGSCASTEPCSGGGIHIHVHCDQGEST